MTTLNIPSSPSQGATYEANGVVYTWDGTKWKADSSYVSNLNGGQLAGFRNQIINGDFRVKNRGGTTTSGSASNEYVIDRWVAGSNTGAWSAGDDVTVPDGQGFMRSIRVGEAGKQTILRQAIELPAAGNAGQFQVGTTWTFSFWASDNSAVTIPTFDFADNSNLTNDVVAASPPAPSETGEIGGPSWKRYSSTFNITGTPAASNACLNAQLFATSARVTGVQLEPGPVATPFEHRPIGTELALCQRYYIKIGGSQYTKLGSLVSSGGGNSFAHISTPVSMRVTPGVSTDQVRSIISNGSITAAQINGVRNVSNGISLDINTDFGLGQFQADGIQTVLNNGYMAFDAEL